MPELRQNIVTGEWVIIAPERAKRPLEFLEGKTTQKGPEESKCVFCLGSESYKARISESELTYVVRNKYPVFVPEKTGQIRSFRVENDFYHAKEALGDHEVIVVKDHRTSLPKFSLPIWRDLLSVMVERYQFHADNSQVEYVMNIYNHGLEAGASIVHPHAQVFASNVVTNEIRQEKHGAENYFEINGSCVFCDLRDHEIAEKTRLIFESERSLAVAFYASRFPFEIWVLPKKHESQFELSSKETLNDIAETMRSAIGMLDGTLSDPPVNFFIHTLPSTLANSSFYHWHVEITPRISRYGGFELGSDVIVNLVSPEEAAKLLRARADRA